MATPYSIQNGSTHFLQLLTPRVFVYFEIYCIQWLVNLLLVKVYLSPVATKLRKGDIGIPFVRQSVSPSVRLSDLNNLKSSTHVWYMHYLQLLNAPFPPNPGILCAGNQRRGTLSFTRMQFFLFVVRREEIEWFYSSWLTLLISLYTHTLYTQTWICEGYFFKINILIIYIENLINIDFYNAMLFTLYTTKER